jgi:hypothetical protein
MYFDNGHWYVVSPPQSATGGGPAGFKVSLGQEFPFQFQVK